MLRSIKDLEGNYTLSAKDGEIGKVEDFYFSEIFWNIKYLVANTGNWLFDRLILISPVMLGSPEWASGNIPVNLTKEKIQNSPPVAKHRPVSAQKEAELLKYYSWPVHFSYGVDTSHFAEMQIMVQRMKQLEDEKSEQENSNQDAYLRSTKEVAGYRIQAKDDSIGHVDDFIFDDKSWIIRYMVVDTRNWLSGRKVLVSPEWIKKIDWEQKQVTIALTKDAIQKSPEFHPDDPVNREYEMQLYDYYGRPTYWDQ